MPTLLKACARVGSDAAVAGAVNPELSNAAAGSRAVTAAVSSIRRDLLMARLLTAGGAAPQSPPHGGRRCRAQHCLTRPRQSRSPRRWSRRDLGRDETRGAFFSKDFGFSVSPARDLPGRHSHSSTRRPSTAALADRTPPDATHLR